MATQVRDISHGFTVAQLGTARANAMVKAAREAARTTERLLSILQC